MDICGKLKAIISNYFENSDICKITVFICMGLYITKKKKKGQKLYANYHSKGNKQHHNLNSDDVAENTNIHITFCILAMNDHAQSSEDQVL
jgi:predicted PolB exonuclease-like 3'-5' exonuclease